MKQNLAPIRPAMTAIAAVIALSSTSLLAQAADTPDAQSAPAIVAPPAPTVAPAPAAVAPDVAPAAPVAAPEPAMKTMSTPVEHTADATAPSVTTGAGEAASVRRQPSAPAAQRRASAPHTTAAAAPVASTPAPRIAPVAKTAAHAVPEPAAQPAAAPAPTAAAPAVSSSTTQNRTTTDETLPVAGAVLFGALAVGAAFAMRRKPRDEDELVLDTAAQSPTVVTADPIIVAPKAAEPVPAAAASLGAEGTTKLPNGFDMSRFGRHTRAAYLGRTPDNPSYSLKRRLKRASFFDQREREAIAAGGAPLKEPVYARSEAGQAAQADNGQVTVRLSPERKRSRFGYILQR